MEVTIFKARVSMFFQEQIEKLQRRIKNIEDNPRPEYLKSNKLRYELELEDYAAVLEAWKEGKPFAALEGLEQLTSPLGFHRVDYDEWGDRVSEPQRYYDIVVNKFGFPEHACDRTMTRLGLFLSGEVPLPRLMLGRRTACDPERWTAMASAKYAGCLFFELDRLMRCDYDNIHYVAEQAAEVIEFAEKSIPGCKYDEDKLIEILELEHQSHQYLMDTYELRKRVPCPLSPQDAFRLNTLRAQFPNLQKAVEYRRMYRDELFERADKHIGGVREEKLRIAWLATGPYGRSTFDLLTKKGVSIPWFHYGVAPWLFGVVRDDYGDEITYGRKLTPLEELVRFRTWNSNVWGELAEKWVDSLIQICRELKIDAAVDFLQPGCITTKNLKRITAQRLKEELGIPTLDLEGREFFATEAGQLEMNRKLEEFLDMCIADKK
ncbi:MAG: 2-hydroxyacyl-CoA dehydratase [Chloroflexi bacterium]|nr:2-hydroxyacyl-CoA dehydratase [Chloroflexota bacterium]